MTRPSVWLAVLVAMAAAAASGGAERAAADAVSYQVDGSHRGFVDAELRPPLGRKWIRRDLPLVRYPLLAGGRVFVVSGDTVQALDPGTGETIWTRTAARDSTLSYGRGRLFIAGGDGVTAVDADAGATIWVAGVAEASAALMVGDTVVVAHERGVSAHRWEDGIRLWDRRTSTIRDGIPASDGDRVFVSGDSRTSALDARVGVELWQRSAWCGYGIECTPRVHRGRVYAPASRSPWLVLDSLTGSPRGSLAATGWGPALAGNAAYVAVAGELRAQSLEQGTVAWRLPPPVGSQFHGPPLVVGGVVYVQAGDEIVAVERSSGSVLWQRSRSLAPTAPAGAMAASGALLVVPARDRLVAFGPGGDTPGVDDPEKTPASAFRFEFTSSRRSVLYGQRVELKLALDGTYGRRVVELQESRFPYRRWRTIARPAVGSYPTYVRARPAINTRYRLVDRNTLPEKVSRVRRVLLELGGRASFYARGPHAVRVRAAFRAPPALRLHKRRLHVYRFRPGRTVGRLAGKLKIRRRSPARYRVAGVVRAPRLHRRDRFAICIPKIPPPGYGPQRYAVPRCGKPRL